MPSAKDSNKARGSTHLVHKATAVGAHGSGRALHKSYSALSVGFANLPISRVTATWACLVSDFGTLQLFLSTEKSPTACVLS